MVCSEPEWERRGTGPNAEERRRLQEELFGLDSDHPEVREFSEHLDRTHRQRPSFTVEGYLSGITDFADSANRAQGLKRVWAVVLVVLLLLGVAVTVWESALFVVSTLFG